MILMRTMLYLLEKKFIFRKYYYCLYIQGQLKDNRVFIIWCDKIVKSLFDIGTKDIRILHTDWIQIHPYESPGLIH